MEPVELTPWSRMRMHLAVQVLDAGVAHELELERKCVGGEPCSDEKCPLMTADFCKNWADLYHQFHLATDVTGTDDPRLAKILQLIISLLNGMLR